jgi:hypothetical protein
LVLRLLLSVFICVHPWFQKQKSREGNRGSLFCSALRITE